MKKRLIKWAKVSAVVVLVLLLALLGFAGLYAFEKPGEPVDFASQMNELARSVQPGAETEPNRYEDIVDLFDRMEEIRAETTGEDEALIPDSIALSDEEQWIDRFGQDVYEKQQMLMFRYVDNLRDAGIFEELYDFPAIEHAYSEIPSGGDPLWWRVTDSHLDNLGELQNIAQELMYLAVYRGREGEIDRAIDLFEQTLALARFESYRPAVISHLVAMSIEALAISQMTTLIIEHRLTNPQLERIAIIMHQQKMLPMDHALRGNILEIDDMIQRCYTDDGNGNGLFSRQYTILNFLGLFYPSRVEITEAINAYSDRVMEALDDSTIAAPRVDTFHPIYGPRIIKTPIVNDLTSNYAKFVTTSRHGRSRYIAFVISVELERFRNDNGSYPSSLEELVPNYFDEVPFDPLARMDRFAYRPTAGDGFSYTLYSLGEDGDDDSGIWDTRDNRLDDRLYVPQN